ncbi:hypothetical protein OOT00_05075 [Desulfobotulus sp. H1]|uniref:Uncharacterized protein n=1 Tax=Desulfobotulus pelophilus TaxID=2823377 RepID=A0ABT3N7C7_9BACT|nr:hypothetical protein [Desulfobotulus pelophilus]MCW7753356.1 hypothetical protein [Desulfobotulus pelophilus]
MGKTLVGVKNLETFICQKDAAIYVDGSMILTPGAKDELTKRGMKIVYGPKPVMPSSTESAYPVSCPPGCTCEACMKALLLSGSASLEALVLAVTGVLKNQYGIRDPEQLVSISSQVVATIRENI